MPPLRAARSTTAPTPTLISTCVNSAVLKPGRLSSPCRPGCTRGNRNAPDSVVVVACLVRELVRERHGHGGKHAAGLVEHRACEPAKRRLRRHDGATISTNSSATEALFIAGISAPASIADRLTILPVIRSRAVEALDWLRRIVCRRRRSASA